jgi:hypothetical protein
MAFMVYLLSIQVSDSAKSRGGVGYGGKSAPQRVAW